ncbi:hypothetical protein ACFFJY_19150 [Fictibacillus aquaticus]|uniref:Uncharacterized protein n=1 Tax=Fictibacillus aquaticus TaxID=2021314 RepID=A0A235F4V0_9BACL|nr:hypothetical protein [Fictibacillus aquaticus]OYD56262.1 hypothetical protein CGZ90_18090 [Fictibacillus aquaticus]
MGAGFWIMIAILILYAAVRIFLGYAEYDTSHLKYRQTAKRKMSDADDEERSGTAEQEEKKIETF